MSIGITGATGQLGRIVVEKLKAKVSADSIVALARSRQKAADLGVQVREFDYNKPENLAEALKGIDKLLIISGNEFGKRAEQHASIIEAARKAGVQFIAYTSLLRADTSILSLAPEHLATETAVKNSGIPYTILRNGWYTENYTGSIGGTIGAGVLLGSAGEGKISSAARADFAEAAVVVLTSAGHENKTYELAGDEAFTLSDYAAEVSHATEKNIPYKNVPIDEYAKVLVHVGLPEALAHFLAGTHGPTEQGDLFDNGHQLSKLIGRPTTSLKQSVADALKA